MKWYESHARDLPWRRTQDPYRIWVSEVMLQQTQVSTVVPYYERFLRRFPTIELLATASQDDVLKLWQGLGYYRRALNLHRAARELIECHDGRVPSDLAALCALPGIGRYIAGAIRSFAFDLPAPILEANTARVLCRLFAVRGSPTSGAVQRRLWSLSEALLPHEAPGRHNQAMMELGALVCVSGSPRCDQCPLVSRCEARAQGIASRLPERARRRPTVDVQDVAVIVRRSERVLIVQIPVTERYGGLWQLPRTTVPDGEQAHEAIRTHVRETLGLTVAIGRRVLTLRHGVTHHRIKLTCYEARTVSGRLRVNGYAACRWETPQRLRRYAFSSPQQKLIAAVQSGGGSRVKGRGSRAR